MNLTKFQEQLLSDPDTLWDIVKIMHPGIPDTVTNNKGENLDVKEVRMKAKALYNWVVIEFRVKGYGMICIIIDNSYSLDFLHGPNITKERMQEVLDKGRVEFRVSRSVLDKDHYPYNPFETFDAVISLLKEKYSVINADEWYSYYYRN